jgi:transposase-like protein
MRCPKCGSLSTVKNGIRQLIDYSLDRKSKKKIQRYRCKECQKRFIKKRSKERYTMKFKIELVRMHVEERMSYRVISKRIKERYSLRLSKNTICRIINSIAKLSKGDIKIREEYRPSWEGYLTVDDKYFSVSGKKKLILTATDSSGDFLHTEIFKEVEQHGFDEFMRFIKEHLRYPVKAITTDLDEMLEKSIGKVFGKSIPHQQCLKHALDIVDRIIELKQKRRSYENALKNKKNDWLEKKVKYEEAERIMGLSRTMFYSAEEKQSKKILGELKVYQAKYPKLIEFFDRSLEKLLTHQKYPLIKKTNNVAENINRQLMRRFKTIESFQKLIYAENYLNLYKNYLRFKPYTDCRGSHKYKNGKSPLEVCGVVLQNKDWLYNAIAF